MADKAWDHDFWERWWQEDFSWENLNDSARDFFAAEEREGRLIKAPDGRHYTRFHLPLAWKNGQTTGKLDWTREQHKVLAKDLETLLSPPTIIYAPLAGVVLLVVPRIPRRDKSNELMFDFHYAFLHVGFKWLQGNFSGHANFGGAAFSGNAAC